MPRDRSQGPHQASSRGDADARSIEAKSELLTRVVTAGASRRWLDGAPCGFGRQTIRGPQEEPKKDDKPKDEEEKPQAEDVESEDEEPGEEEMFTPLTIDP